jgi:hypothetical protein
MPSAGVFAGAQILAQDLSGRRLGDRLDELDAADLLVRSDVVGDEAITSSAVSPESGAGTMNAFGISCLSSSSTPMTAASITFGWPSSSASSSAGAIW